MNCLKCGEKNTKEAKFCSKCGAELKEEIKEKSEVANQIKEKANKTKIVCLEYLKLIIDFILKPATTLKENINKLDEIKNSGILAIIIAAISTIICLIGTMINTVVIKYNWLNETTVVWRWENLKNINYISSIFSSLISVLLLIAVIAGVYYIAGLIIKKKVKYPRLVGIVSLILTPLLLTSLLISPILSVISIRLSSLVLISGFIYTLILLHESINNEFKLEENKKYYFNLVCYLVLLIISYISFSMIVSTVVGTDINGLLGLIR